MTEHPVILSSSPVLIDFSLPETLLFGTQAVKVDSGLNLMWSGNVIPDNELKYSGSSNDRDPILVRIGGTVPTNFIVGYHPEDTNLDGVVKYAGASNDRDLILVNIGGLVPTTVRNEQLP